MNDLRRAEQRLVFICALLAGLGLSYPAWAQVAAAPGGVDFGPVLTNLITAGAGILVVAAGILSKFAVSWLSSKTRLSDSQFEAGLAARLNDILLKAIDYAEAYMKAQVADPTSQIHSVRFDNMFVGIAVDYAMRSMPDIIKYFGLTPERIGDMIRSRLNAYMATPLANSGAVKPVGGTAGL